MTSNRPNILLITCDQYRFPRFSYGPDAGFAEPLKNILGFQGEVDETNPYARYFPGLLALRENSVVLRNHTIASSACIPSRAVIYTGQYGTRTGVTQTDGLFKSGDAPNFPWLPADGVPTLGSWMRQAGYTTHYFGKWHVSQPADHSLKAYGFDDWETSYPEPHGAATNNLGLYRDAGFSDEACAFIRRKALSLDYNRFVANEQQIDPYAKGPDTTVPWFAVASFTNPHDIATYPAVLGQALPTPDGSSTQGVFGPLTVPLGGQRTPVPSQGTARIDLNLLGFPQDCASASPTQDEDLSTKPACQFDYSYKVALGLNAKTGFNGAEGMGLPTEEEATAAAVAIALQSQIPFQLSADPAGGAVQFLQLYAWLHAVVDTHISRVLKTLEETGQADNTIVIFLADHGEYAGAHGMMIEKWHTAYQEALHVPVVVRFPPSMTSAAEHQLDQLTSHIDILPTILGLAGVDEARREEIRLGLGAPPLPGVDLSGLIWGTTTAVTEPDGSEREGVLFYTGDEITAPLPPMDDPQNIKSEKEFAVYNALVEAVRHGTPKHEPVAALASGAVLQPNNIHCVRTRTHKLARYFDPNGVEPDQWEMYDMVADPNEATNLVQVAVSPPTARTDLPPPWDAARIQADANQLLALLDKLVARDLTTKEELEGVAA